MSDTNLLAAGIEDKRENVVGVSESLVNFNLEMKRCGFGHVDNTDAVSTGLVTHVVGKCHPLLIRYRNNPAEEESPSCSYFQIGHCQGGFIRHERKILPNSPGGTPVVKYCVNPITAKHNLRTVIDETSGTFKPAAATFTVQGRHEVVVNWPELAWEPNTSDRLDLRAGTNAIPAIHDYGFDVSVGPTIYGPKNPCCEPDSSFDKVRKDLKLKKGMKVGMAVTFEAQAKPTKTSIKGNKHVKLPENFNDKDIEKYFGLPGQLNIYTGEILHVGPNFIEYNINSFTGCSGAIVFLLDMHQPPFVSDADVGKAVAIHAGAHPTLTDRNYGFLINEHPHFKNA